MIRIKRSPTADTRTCDFSKVDKNTLLRSSEQHIMDVREGLEFFCGCLYEASLAHDFDKIEGIDEFHADFITGFKQTGWWDRHRHINRHHLNVGDGVPVDVNLVDVIEHIVDCVMAGAARSSKGTEGVYELKLPNDLLQKAFRNTVGLLKKNVSVEEQEQS